MSRFLALIHSWGSISRHVLFGHRPDVILYYPQHFNRSKAGNNPYFSPIVALCEEHGIKYLMLEEPDGSTPYPRNPKAMKADALFWFVTIARKLLRILNKNVELVQIDRSIARFLDVVTLHKFRARRVITISNSMVDIFAALNSDSRVYDYQHGILFNGHEGYFEAPNRLCRSYQDKRHCLMVWGSLYERAFRGVMTDDELKDRIKVAGYPMATPVTNTVCTPNRKYIVISLQITADGEMWYMHSPKMLYKCLDQLQDLGYEVLLKHHPRFNKEVDLTDLQEKYPFVSFTKLPLGELASQTLLHITWSSTTCFEYANYGVPTFFLIDEVLHHGRTVFYEQYFYPLYKGIPLREVVTKRLKEKALYAEDCQTVRAWYKSAYAPFDKELMLQILTANEN